MYRIIIGSIFHETNTFLPLLTGLEEFRKRNYLIGDDVVQYFHDTHTVLGAFIETLRQNDDCEIIPSIAAIAEPSGLVKSDAIHEIKTVLSETLIREGKVDGILLSLHGAMVTEDEEDGDGDILQSLRAFVGNNVPIVTTLDLHANLTEKMVTNADVFIPYQEYPHVDMYDCGLEAAKIMLKILWGEINPVMRWRHLPLLPALTSSGNYSQFRKTIQDIKKDKDVLSASILHGFYLADTKDTGAATLAITNGDSEAAQKIADDLAWTFWINKEYFLSLPTYTPEEAIEDANHINDKPVVFADICDNPGIGSTGDGTHLLRAMIDAKVKDAAYAIITDAETVNLCHKAGVGAYVDIHLGRKQYPELLGTPINCRAYVKKLQDGRYINRGPMHGGLQVNLQKSAVIVVDGITIIVSSIATQTYDIEIFQSHGIMLSDFKILVVKSSIHYRAAFGPYSKKMYSIECPGALTVNPENVNYKKCSRFIYPLDKNTFFQK